jgi:hypothetical protein
MIEKVLEIIANHHEDGVSESDCEFCSSGCCSQGGFAILENVLEIYKLYVIGQLKRKGMKFKENLILIDFIFEYFDIWERPVSLKDEEDTLMFFHMKSIDEKGRTISIPGESYWDNRSDLFRLNPWLNKGCVFLSHFVPHWFEDDGKIRYCILHGRGGDKLTGAKPIDCIFYTCIEPYKAKTPSSEKTDAWFFALSKAFPNSKERFEEIYNQKR